MKKIRIILDILMYVIFIILMGHHITGDLIHEILGVTLFILFIIHNILNIKFYKKLFKGKYNLKRIFLTLVDIMLLICMIGMIISGIMISNKVFSFLNIKTSSLGLKLHMLSTSWGFIIMSIHLGLHLNVLINKVNSKMKDSTFEYIYYLVLILIMVYGIYSFIELNFISDMFLLNPFKAYDFDESPIVFYIHTISSSLFISLLICLINKININKKGEWKASE